MSTFTSYSYFFFHLIKCTSVFFRNLIAALKYIFCNNFIVYAEPHVSSGIDGVVVCRFRRNIVNLNYLNLRICIITKWIRKYKEHEDKSIMKSSMHCGDFKQSIVGYIHSGVFKFHTYSPYC